MTKKSAIVLAMHGAPPNDFPRDELTEFFGLHFRLEHVPHSVPESLSLRHDELDVKLRTWPRSAQNDPYWSASHDLARKLGESTGLEVRVGFNEFCGPSIDDSIEDVIKLGARTVTVVTPMMTQGGEHSEVDIPAAIDRVKRQHPGVHIAYAWPFATSDVAEFLAEQIQRLGAL
ncbi:MAG: sirohydrochlorin chelatase [Candidatus Thorarchaeota archaeon]|jgi:sirohydrochlorin cobaltochelatase